MKTITRRGIVYKNLLSNKKRMKKILMAYSELLSVAFNNVEKECSISFDNSIVRMRYSLGGFLYINMPNEESYFLDMNDDPGQ